MRQLLTFAVLAVLGGCAPAPVPDAGGSRPEAAGGAPTTDAEVCVARGGRIQPVCMRGGLQCVIPYADAGQPCRDGDDCEGDCRADVSATGDDVVGRCQADSNPCGCFALVEDGRVDGALCVD